MVKKGKELETKKTATLSKYLHFEQETLHDHIAADLGGMIHVCTVQPWIEGQLNCIRI